MLGNIKLLVIGSSVLISACATPQNNRPPGIFFDRVRPGDNAPSPAPRPITPAGLGITKHFEGFRTHPYSDPARFCTIAYGHLLKKSPCDGTEAQDFLAGISELQGEELLNTDMSMAQRGVTRVLPATDLSNEQFSALCDFVFNVGADKFQTSTLRSVVERREFEQVAPQLRRWVIAAGVPQRGLELRREAEISLFYNGAAIPKKHPADISQPDIDITTGEPQGAQ
jgi:lysozyme